MSETEYTVKFTARFKKDYKRTIKRGLEIGLSRTVVTTLAQGVKLPEKYKDHELSGDMAGFRECHIQPDWLLIYYIDDEVPVLILTRTGTHSDLFDK